MAVAFITALTTAAMLAQLAAAPGRWMVFSLTAMMLGLTCAVVQIDNLTMPMQVGFPLVHAFALTTLMALARGLKRERKWLVLAFALDFLAVFSLATGIFVGAAAVALSIWLRKFDRALAYFLVFNLALIVTYSQLVPHLALPVPAPEVALSYFLTFLGGFMAHWLSWCLSAGVFVALLSAALFLWLTLRISVCKSKNAEQVAVLGAFAFFMILEAASVSYSRAHFGVGQAMSLRYTTCTLLSVATLFAVAWRLFPFWLSRIAVLACVTSVVFFSNPSFVEGGWLARNRALDDRAAEIRKGYLQRGTAAWLFIDRKWFDKVIWRFRSEKLGRFRDNWVNVYRDRLRRRMVGAVPLASNVADYDGDGRADAAAWRPADGTWFVVQSGKGSLLSRQWGLPGDTPVPGSYDGDGRTDFAVWRQTNGT